MESKLCSMLKRYRRQYSFIILIPKKNQSNAEKGYTLCSVPPFHLVLSQQKAEFRLEKMTS